MAELKAGHQRWQDVIELWKTYCLAKVVTSRIPHLYAFIYDQLMDINGLLQLFRLLETVHGDRGLHQMDTATEKLWPSHCKRQAQVLHLRS